MRCPNCNCELHEGGAGESDLSAIQEEMLRTDPGSVPVSDAVPLEAMSEAVPYEAMQAEPGMVIVMDEQGEPLQTTEAQARQRGLRIVPPGGAPAESEDNGMMAALQRALRGGRK